MKLIQKLSLLASLAPFSLALASNPSICIKPEMLYQAASSGVIHDIAIAAKNHHVVPYRWYSVGLSSYSEEMELLLNNKHHWEDPNASGHQQNPTGVLCMYFDKQTLSSVDLQLFTTTPPQSIFKK